MKLINILKEIKFEKITPELVFEKWVELYNKAMDDSNMKHPIFQTSVHRDWINKEFSGRGNALNWLKTLPYTKILQYYIEIRNMK